MSISPRAFLERLNRRKQIGDEAGAGMTAGAKAAGEGFTKIAENQTAYDALQQKLSDNKATAKRADDELGLRKQTALDNKAAGEADRARMAAKDAAERTDKETDNKRLADAEAQRVDEGKNKLTKTRLDEMIAQRVTQEMSPGGSGDPSKVAGEFMGVVDESTAQAMVAAEAAKQKAAADKLKNAGEDRLLENSKTESEIKRNLRPPNTNMSYVDPQVREARALDIEAKKATAKEKAEAPARKKQEQIVEINNFAANIRDNIHALRAQIKETGMVETFGSANADMERRLSNLATDWSKLQDPGSVAREGEVEIVKKGLFKPGIPGPWGTMGSTALEGLDNLENELEKRINNAYRVRKIERTGASQPAAPDPKAARIEEIKKLLGKK